ncbi:MAG TPA: SusC/RagA family TonB-linked outer membrane protein, partial [Sphingobacterium sp.]|nr:SusC/RagA family TonB-linked outer membrane protein [Sphingobacterium sp.]
MKKQVAKLLGTLSLLLIILTLSAQTGQRAISGKVTDVGGQPLPGVSVNIKEGNATAVTNEAGTYTISIPNSPSSVLIFSFVGMQTQEIMLGANNVVNVVLEPEAQSLEEVVAIGYGTVRKKDLTGSVAIINGEDLAKRNEMMLSQALQGAAPGVTVTRSSGLPGATATIRVRGITTIGDSNPLILVDGIPVESIDRVNPQDVESISVLKDAASASIYGARAAAGVILITTKQAKNNQLNLEYQGLYGMITPTQFPGTVDHVRYMEMINEVAWNDGGNLAGAEYGVYSKDFIEDYLVNNRLTSAERFPIINWVDYLIKDYAPNTAHGLSLTYGNEFVKTKASFNYEKEDALYNNRSYDRVTSRLNNEFRITKFLSADVSGSYLRSANLQPVNNPLSHAYKYGPLETPYWADGRISKGRNGTNTWARVNHGGFNNTWGDELIGRLALNFKPIEGLTISGVFAPSIRSVKGKQFIRQVPYYELDNLTTTSGFVGGNDENSLTESRSEVRTTTKQLTANYNADFSKNHNLSIMAGYEDYYRFSEGLNASSDKLSLSDYPYLDRANLDFLQNSGNANENAYNSYFGRVMYSYANKYLLQSNIRFDASSRFHPDYRYS